MVGGTRWKWIGHGWAPVSLPGTMDFKLKLALELRQVPQQKINLDKDFLTNFD